ncbi:ArsR/SmtB family transcription factor [Bacillus daqingensis]|uniref:ArsR/SmtB family transcription factor n=1 Tax=Bacillus daqingensis TaxID=872396 RepID=A0ABV9NUH2_9BACI
MKGEQCSVYMVHEQKVQRAKSAIQSKQIKGMTSIFKALADETRLKIAFALWMEEELCVCDAAAVIESSTASASHHLRLLHRLGLTKQRREGKLVYYSLDDEHVRQLILIAAAHQQERKGEL